MKKVLATNKSLLRDAYVLLNVDNPFELSERYLAEDQKIVTSKISDYHSEKLITNKVKRILEQIDARLLSKDERHERRLILWLWHHHAISYAVWGYKDRKRARQYSALALRYQPKNHPNHITRLLYLLIRDRLSDARQWARCIKEKTEKETAMSLLKFYMDGGFFM